MRTLIFSIIFLTSMALIAQETSLEKHFSKDIEIATSVNDTWGMLSDVSKFKEWDHYIVDARLEEHFADHAQGSLVTANSKVVDFKIIDFKEGESYTIRYKLSSGMLYKKHTVTSTETGSKVITEVWYKGLSFKNFEKYMGNDYASVLENELRNLKNLLQR